MFNANLNSLVRAWNILLHEDKPINFRESSFQNYDETDKMNKRKELMEASAMSKEGKLCDFHWTPTRSSHSWRRMKILEKYPEIVNLFGYDMREGFFCLFTIFLQFVTNFCIYKYDPNWPAVFFLSYFISATINHSLFLAMHELCHSLFWPKIWMNKYCIILTNLPLGIPAGISFWRYHLDHHIWLGVDEKDPDIPTELEGKMCRNKFTKLIWVLLFPLTYTLRPLFRRPKKICFMDIVNWVTVITSDIVVLYFGGPKCLFYFIGGALLSMSIHPLNGHLIAEHYQFPYGESVQETYSYYGCGNLITYNAGYHIEHHDFPHIPGSRLPQVTKIASEFYDFPYHTSWTRVIYDFIMLDEVGPFSRVKRRDMRGGEIQPPHKKFHKNEIPSGAYWNGAELSNKTK